MNKTTLGSLCKDVIYSKLLYKNSRVLKIVELFAIYITLIWLLFFSFFSRPFDIHQDGLSIQINDQHGTVYLILIFLSLSSSAVIIARLIKPQLWLRIFSIFIAFMTVVLTIIYWSNYGCLSETIRKFIYGTIYFG